MDIQLPYHSLVNGYLKYNHPEKDTDNSGYDVLTGRIYSIYTARLAEGLLDEADIVLSITTQECHSKVDYKTLVQRWSIGLGPKQHNLKTTTQVGIRHAVQPLTCWYKKYTIQG